MAVFDVVDTSETASSRESAHPTAGVRPLLGSWSERTSRARMFWRRLLRTRMTAFSLVVIAILILCAILAPWIAPYDPITDMVYSDANQGPSLTHWFGTDHLGRDTFSRIVFGARISLLVGIMAMGIGVFIGVPVGILAGFVGGTTDTVLMRISDAIWAFPSLMLALAITAALGPGIGNAMIAIGLVRIPYFARLARGSTLSVREMEYATAARSVGVQSTRIMSRHVFPNITAPIIVQATLGLGVAIITEAALSFLGVGVQPPNPSWGVELRAGYTYLNVNPWLGLFPGLAIFVTVLAFNFLGDGLRTALDPKLWQRGGG